MADALRATVAELRASQHVNWTDEDGHDMASFVQEEDDITPCFGVETNAAFQVCEELLRTLCPASLPFRQRLGHAVPAAVEGPLAWTHLLAAESTEVLGAESEASELAAKVEVNSGGQVFFALLSSSGEEHREEAVVLKFCNNRHLLQSEQMAAELARHLGVPGPASRVLLKSHDSEEWGQLSAAAAEVCPSLSEVLQKKQSMLLLQYVPGSNLEKEEVAFQPERLADSCRALGRLFVLDLMLGNSDRLPLNSLNWRGNPGNVLWQACEGSSRCVPIDAAVARRPPKMLVRDMDEKASCLLELVQLDRATCHKVLLEALSCNSAASTVLEADWAPNEAAWAERHGGRAAADAKGVMSSAKAFNEGVKSALASALQEQGLLEMLTDVVNSWLDNFKADMKEHAAKPGAKPKLKLGETKELREISKEAGKNSEMQERLASWQDLLREKSKALALAADDWAGRRGLTAAFSFRGFLGDSVLNPVADAYELLVRLKQLTSRIKVLQGASCVSRPADLAPKAPLFVGGATSLCLHLLRQLGVTHILNCTQDLPAPSDEELGDLKWHRLCLADVENQDLGEALEEGLQLIDQVQSAGGKMLIHCHEGKSRSVSLCVAYLIARQQMPLADALAFVKSKRPISRPNAGFLKQLVAFELAKLGSNSLLPEELPKGKPVLSSLEGRKAGC
eukprot:TRINITY_DN47146_c0_g1_i1.p1 TRINITY_DN47146_c0_g1~~TRINITY_DN47146_c0_g1_i1.p1  ORF type:complete len:680 (+),score=196.20 TRINITY_DN47146_c0_g1_i1:106-2145(+)